MMALLQSTLHWFTEPSHLVTAFTTIAAPGGIWFYLDKFNNRIRIKVRKLVFGAFGSGPRTISFEAENIGPTTTSFEPRWVMTGYPADKGGHSIKRKLETVKFMFDEQDSRQLQPHVARGFHAFLTNAECNNLNFLWFMTFHIELTRGGTVRIRVRNAELVPLGFLRFHWERLLCLVFGKVPG